MRSNLLLTLSLLSPLAIAACQTSTSTVTAALIGACDGNGHTCEQRDDCRIVSDNGSQPPANIPCWCTQC
ncbi:MAG TPA: hypothetical protein VHW23_26265 [Kofleriaceae bacterium]|jgi:hypothetical protein|nr:hypothetical protein [Kofleriaceae bacterium]